VPVGSITINFDKPVDPTTFTTADINSFNGPNGAITATAVTAVAAATILLPDLVPTTSTFALTTSASAEHCDAAAT